MLHWKSQLPQTPWAFSSARNNTQECLTGQGFKNSFMWEVKEDLSAYPWPLPQTHLDLICFIIWLYKTLGWISHQDKIGWGHRPPLNSEFPQENTILLLHLQMKFSWASAPCGTKGTFQHRHQGPFLYNNPACHSTLALLPCAWSSNTALLSGSWGSQVYGTPCPLHTPVFPAWSFTLSLHNQASPTFIKLALSQLSAKISLFILLFQSV